MDNGKKSSESHDAQLLLNIHSFYKDLDPMVPPFLRVADSIKAAIVQGLIKHGEPVPSTTSIARQLGINQMTAVKALQAVVSLGVIQRARGANHIVCEDGRKNCAEMIEGEILGELRYLHRKMKHYLINRNQISQWLKGFEDADEDIEKIKG